MFHYGIVGGYVNLKPKCWVCSSFGISIMIHIYDVYGWLFELETCKTCLKFTGAFCFNPFECVWVVI
jgi:hypothetical protein